MTGEPEFNAVYVLSRQPSRPSSRPGPAPTCRSCWRRSTRLGIDADDLAHIVLTHIHLDHAGRRGRARRPASRAPRSGCTSVARPTWPTRPGWWPARPGPTGRSGCVAFFGETAPVSRRAAPRASIDGDAIDARRSLARRSCTRPATRRTTWRCMTRRAGRCSPARRSDRTCRGRTAFRPALPPPEVDVEAAIASIERIRARRADLTADVAFRAGARADRGVRRGGRADRGVVRGGRAGRSSADPRIGTDRRRRCSAPSRRREFLADDAADAIDLARYDAIGSIAMNAAGLARYWRKRWRARGGATALAEIGERVRRRRTPPASWRMTLRNSRGGLVRRPALREDVAPHVPQAQRVRLGDVVARACARPRKASASAKRP